MTSAIGPGDWVECVHDGPCWSGRPSPFVVGGVYRVESLSVVPMMWDNRGELLVRIDGYPNTYNPCRDSGWAADRFRLIYRPDETLIERLLSAPVQTEPQLTPAGSRSLSATREVQARQRETRPDSKTPTPSAG